MKGDDGCDDGKLRTSRGALGALLSRNEKPGWTEKGTWLEDGAEGDATRPVPHIGFVGVICALNALTGLEFAGNADENGPDHS